MPAPPAAAQRGRGRPALDSTAQRKKILAAASRLFIAKGFAGTTLDEIGTAARVTKRTIYQHIGDKSELYRAVILDRLNSATDFELELAPPRTPLRDVVLALARQILREAYAPHAIALERALTLESERFPRLVQGIITNGMAVLNSRIAHAFERLAHRGDLQLTDLSRTADLFYDVIVGNRAFRRAMGHDEPSPDDTDLAERVDMFIHGHLLRPCSPAGGPPRRDRVGIP